MQDTSRITTWKELLLTTTAGQLSKWKKQRSYKDIITIPSSSTLAEGLNTLASHNILSAPVIDDARKFLGFVDVMDIVGVVLTAWREQATLIAPFDQNQPDLQAKFFQSPVTKAINFSLWNYPIIVMATSPLSEVIDAFWSPERHFKPHRVVVLNTENQMQDIISQSDLIRFADAHRDSLPAAVNKTIKELGGIRACKMLPIDSSVVDALTVLYNYRISGLALINYEGQISGNFSASDLRGLRPESFGLFRGSVLQFLAKNSTPKAPIMCTSDTTLNTVIHMLASENVHRIFIVDEFYRPHGLISLSDVVDY